MKMPFDKKFRAEITAAAQAAGSDGIGTSDFWRDFEKELSRTSMRSAAPNVEPRKITVDKTAPSGQ